MILLNAGFNLTQVGFTLQTAVSGLNQTLVKYGPSTVLMSLGSGTAAQQGDRGFSETRSLTNAAQTYTISALPNGQAAVKLRLFYLLITSDIGSGGTLTIAPAGSHPWASVNLVGLLPGSVVLITWPDAAGAPAVASTTDAFTVTVTGTVVYDIAVVGTSA